MIAALYIDERGPYVGRPDVDAWGISRDAKLYDGPHPVVGYELPGQVRVSDGEREGWTIVGPEEHFEIVDGSP